MKHLAFIIVFFVACFPTTKIDATHPGPTGPGTEFPCGYSWHSCHDANHMCCPDHHDCGMPNQGVNGVPFSGCQAGYCCFNGEDDLTIGGPRNSTRVLQVSEKELQSGK